MSSEFHTVELHPLEQQGQVRLLDGIYYFDIPAAGALPAMSIALHGISSILEAQEAIRRLCASPSLTAGAA